MSTQALEKPLRKKQSLGENMAAHLQGRPAGRLRSLLDRESKPRAIAVPFAEDTYEIDLAHINPDPDQPRKHFDQTELEQLALSIKENGVLQPITVRQSEEDPTKYLIITGERRFRATQLARFRTIPAIVRSGRLARERIEREQLVENIQRADLDPIEAARALSRWMDEHSLSQRNAANRLGKPKTWIAELLAILTLPHELLEKAENTRLGKSALMELASIKNATERGALFERMLSSKNAWKVIKEAKSHKKSERLHTYRRSFSVEGFPYTFTVSADTHPDDVQPEHVIEALVHLVEQLTETSHRERGSGRTTTT